MMTAILIAWFAFVLLGVAAIGVIVWCVWNLITILNGQRRENWPHDPN